jgi:hypothetical protein
MQVFIFVVFILIHTRHAVTYKSKISQEILRNGCRRKNLMKRDDLSEKKTGGIRVKKAFYDRNFSHG